ncbi:hypothetical protein [Clostridium brassicae]|uniref:Uncharacterized protein n=1 Tax=Clostridium brassicae TaxID=2999072 RepID=A0ABT4DB61_9CLOT|nr:hypothetical protein [Clostridium brassicae]MCY6959423.1 hypothetical protein [Clostridium brassicae]
MYTKQIQFKEGIVINGKSVSKSLTAFTIMVSLVTSLFTGINPKIAKAEETKKTKITRPFVRATKDELKETLVIDGVTWKRISLVEEKKQFFPEIRFSHHRELITNYYLLWNYDNKDGSKGHLSKGKQTNYWNYHDNGYGFQSGYKVWDGYESKGGNYNADKDLSLRVEITQGQKNTSSGKDFLNNEFQTKDKNGLEYVFQTGGSFTDDIMFYASKEVIEEFLKTDYGESSTFNLNDFKRSAKLENRMVRPTDEGTADPKVSQYVESHQTDLHSKGDCRDSSIGDKLENAPAGINYNIYNDYYKKYNFEQYTNANTDISKIKDKLVVVEKAKKKGDIDILGKNYFKA